MGELGELGANGPNKPDGANGTDEPDKPNEPNTPWVLDFSLFTLHSSLFTLHSSLFTSPLLGGVGGGFFTCFPSCLCTGAEVPPHTAGPNACVSLAAKGAMMMFCLF